MKLLYCLRCQDIVKLDYDLRYCKCAESCGQYVNKRDAVVAGDCMSLALDINDIPHAVMAFWDSDTFKLRCWSRPNDGEHNPHTQVKPDLLIAKHGSPMRIGQRVRWTSQSSGVIKTKQGRILAEVPPGKGAEEVLVGDFTKYNLQGLGGGGPRDHVSYLVAVPPKSKRGKPRVYWPWVSKIERLPNEPSLL